MSDAVLSVSTDGQQKVLATSLLQVGFPPPPPPPKLK